MEGFITTKTAVEVISGPIQGSTPYTWSEANVMKEEDKGATSSSTMSKWRCTYE